MSFLSSSLEDPIGNVQEQVKNSSVVIVTGRIQKLSLKACSLFERHLVTAV